MNKTQQRTLLGVLAVVAALGVWLATRPTNEANRTDSRGLNAAQVANIGRIVFSVGRVEPVEGEVEVSAQMAGTLVSLTVTEGERVAAGALLATVDARREKAQLALAQARRARVEAGYGAEEIAAVAAQRDAVAAELAFARSERERAHRLRTERVLAEDVWEARQQRVDTLQKQVASWQKQFEAMQRGPLPEEIAVARAEVEVARAHYELCEVRAPFTGTVLHLYRRAGDQVLLNFPTPILRMADTDRLQVRVEVNEADAQQIRPGMEGSFSVFGGARSAGRLRVRTVLPSFGPKRLFDPDTAARVDTRTLQVLCDIVESKAPVYSGQRVTVGFEAGGHKDTE